MVSDVVFQGGGWRVELDLAGVALETTVPDRAGGSIEPPLAVGATVSVWIDPAGVQVLNG